MGSADHKDAGVFVERLGGPAGTRDDLIVERGSDRRLLGNAELLREFAFKRRHFGSEDIMAALADTLDGRENRLLVHAVFGEGLKWE